MSGPLADPAAAFDALVLAGALPESLAEAYDVVALPGGAAFAIAESDLVIRRALGEGAIASVLPAMADPDVTAATSVPCDRLVLRPRPARGCGCGCKGGTAAPVEAEAAPAVCAPAPETDAKGARPLIRRPSRRPVVGYAQQCLNRWMAGHAAGTHVCGDPAYVAESFRVLRTNHQLPLVEDCVFGANTDRATRAFQACHRLGRDGAIGRETWPVLETYAPGRAAPPVVPPVTPPVTPPPVVPPVTPPVTPPSAAVTVLDVDRSFGLFAEFVMPIDGDPPRNLFRGADRRASTAPPDARVLASLRDHEAAGTIAPRDPRASDRDFLVSLRGLLVLPAVPPANGTPLVLLVHGNFDEASPSYQGYEYLQRDLAGRGIGSFSVDVNATNSWPQSTSADNQRRAEMVALYVALLVAAQSNASPPGSPLRLRLGDAFVPLPEAVRRTDDPRVRRLRELGDRLRAARVDLGRVGLLGHSRSARAVQVFAENVVTASLARRPLPCAPTPEEVVDDVTATILRGVRAPVPGALRAMVSLQGDDDGLPLHNLPELLLLVLVGTHDEDTGMSGVGLYEAPQCAKAMCVVHGATHGRFNSVWRASSGKRRAIDEFAACQQPPVVLDVPTHERVLTTFAGDVFEARLRDVPAKLRLLTGERRDPSLRAQVVRTWLFPHPMRTSVQRLADVGFRSPASAPLVSVTPEARREGSQDNSHLEKAASFVVWRCEGATAEAVARIHTGDGVSRHTHVSFRMSKDFHPTGPLASTIRLRNFSVLLRDARGATVGREVSGADTRAVPAVLHRPLPVRCPNHDEGGRCVDCTVNLMQTVEVAIPEFLRGTTATAADLARVTTVVIRLLPENGVHTPDVWRFADIALTTRTGV